jgi:hypothetical protein
MGIFYFWPHFFFFFFPFYIPPSPFDKDTKAIYKIIFLSRAGFAFVFYSSVDEAQKAVEEMNGQSLPNDRSRLKVEIAKSDGFARERDAKNKNMEPTKTLFIVGYDPTSTKPKDIEDVSGGWR